MTIAINAKALKPLKPSAESNLAAVAPQPFSIGSGTYTLIALGVVVAGVAALVVARNKRVKTTPNGRRRAKWLRRVR